MRLIVIGLIATAIVYAPSLDFGMIATFDDAGYITNNKLVQDWWSQPCADRLLTPQIGYPTPLPTAIHALVQAWIPTHLTLVLRAIGLAAHLLSGFLVFVLSRRLLAARFEDLAVVAGGTLATLWLLHPVQVESVMWLSNLKSTLSVTFVLGSLVLAWRLIELQGSRPLNVVGALACLVLGLASKPTAIVALPLFAVLCLFQTDWKTALKNLIPLLIPALILGVLVAINTFGGHGDFAKVSALVDDGITFRAQQGLLALSTLAQIIILPIGLGPNYSHPPQIPLSMILPGLILAIAFIAALTVAWWKDRRDLVGALLFAAVAWAPYSHIVFLPRFAADTYASLPLFGVLLAIALIVPTKKYAFPTATAFALIFLVLTSIQTQRWKDGETLWGPELQSNPLSVASLQHVAFAQFARGDQALAIQTIETHWAAFRTHGRYPLWIGELFLNHDPILALNFATEAILNSTANQLTDDHYLFFLRALATAQVPLPDTPEVLRVYQDARTKYQSNPEWQKILNID